MVRENLVQNLSFSFSLNLIFLYKNLVESREYIISKQLLRSGTSIGANVEEALAAQSRNDFIHKMSIASKEARETKYWLRLLDESKMVNLNYTEYLSKIDTIVNILTRIIKTAQSNIQNPKSKI